MVPRPPLRGFPSATSRTFSECCSLLAPLISTPREDSIPEQECQSLQRSPRIHSLLIQRELRGGTWGVFYESQGAWERKQLYRLSAFGGHLQLLGLGNNFQSPGNPQSPFRVPLWALNVPQPCLAILGCDGGNLDTLTISYFLWEGGPAGRSLKLCTNHFQIQNFPASGKTGKEKEYFGTCLGKGEQGGVHPRREQHSSACGQENAGQGQENKTRPPGGSLERHAHSLGPQSLIHMQSRTLQT